MYKVFEKGEGEIKKEAGKGLTFFKMFRAKQKEDRKGLTFGGFNLLKFLTKWDFVRLGMRKFFRRGAMVGFVFGVVVLAVCGVMPTNGVEATFDSNGGRGIN